MTVEADQRDRLAVERFPVLGMVAEDADDQRHGPLGLTEVKQVVDQLQQPARPLGGRGLALPEQKRLLRLALFQEQVDEMVARVARGHLHELPLEPEGRREVAFLLGQRRELLQECQIARLVGEKAFQFPARRAKVARDFVGLGDAEREGAIELRDPLLVASEPFQTFEKAVELVGVDVELGLRADLGAFARGVVRLVEGPPVQLDGLVGSPRLGERAGQIDQWRGLIGSDPDGAPKNLDPLRARVELDAEVREEPVLLDVAGRGGEEVSTGLESGVSVVQL